MEIRAEKWIGNVHGQPNQNVWSAASWRASTDASYSPVFFTFDESHLSVVWQLHSLSHRMLVASF